MSDNGAGGEAGGDDVPENKVTIQEVLGKGPIQNRGCTDCWCLFVLLGAWGAFVYVSVLGFADSNLARLYLPRDYSGGYCDTEKNWGTGWNTKGKTKQSFTMNVSAATDLIVKQFMCSTPVRNVMAPNSGTGLLAAGDQQFEYLCSCCLVPCASCSGSLQVGGDLSPTNIRNTIQGKLQELTGVTNPANLYSANGNNGKTFVNMWSSVTLYFNEVCLESCNINFVSARDGDHRDYAFNLSKDNPMAYAYEKLTSVPTSALPQPDATMIDELQNIIRQDFTFKALPASVCPYPASRCVPMPGIEFEEVAAGYCQFKMTADVVKGVGEEASSAFTSLGGESLASGLGETFGKWVGDFLRSIDAFIAVIFCSCIIGFLYLILLRFAVGICVWLSIFFIFAVLTFGGALCWVRSFQCNGAPLFDTARQVGVASIITVGSQIGGEASDESISGDGTDYRGAQQFTKSGDRCQNWATASAAEIMQDFSREYNLTNYPATGIGARSTSGPCCTYNNYCRNPVRASQPDRKGSTIWCFTTNANNAWEECQPIGVIKPQCNSGYAINSKELRAVLEVSGYVLWVLAGIYVFAICFLANRIRLAIVVNKVATIFVRHTPLILITPAVQAIVAALWVLVWALSAAFMISQVPADAVSSRAYPTYAEAYGTDTVPGQCTSSWPAGSVWKDEENCELINGTYSCWRCAPPRYTLDWRFAVSFFVFLWNNALIIAIGQFIIAAACCGWFFTRNNEKGSKGVIGQAIRWTWRYHLGSLAFGSFIVAFVQFVRYLLKYYEQQANAQKNKVMVLIFKICQCLLWCFEKCIKFLNKNAYIQVALYGTPFCTSAKKAFYLILRNAARFGVVAVLGSAIRVIGILFITGATAALGYFIFTGLHSDLSPAVSVVIYVFVGYVISKLFTNVFGLAVDSVLQCFLACEEMGLSSFDENGFVPSPLWGWLKESGGKPEEAEIK